MFKMNHANADCEPGTDAGRFANISDTEKKPQQDCARLQLQFARGKTTIITVCTGRE